MPLQTIAIEIGRPLIEVFDYLARPTNLCHLAPPEMQIQLVQGPERLELGSMMHWKARRMGVSQSLVNEVTAFEEGSLIIEEQRQGPFKRWVFRHRFEAIGDRTRLAEELAWEPPGGMLGFFVSAATITKELAKLFEFRERQMKELLE